MTTTAESGFEHIDNEHATLLKALKQFREIDPGDREALLVGFDEITTIARLHFHNEERLMREVDYGSLEHHQGEHESLLKAINNHRRQLVNQEQFSAHQVWKFLLDWVTRHTYTEDLEFKAYYENSIRGST